MGYKKIVFIGPLGRSGGVPETGSSIKNYYILQQLRNLHIPVCVVNTSGWKSNPAIFLKLAWKILTHPKSRIILSTSFASAYTFIKYLSKIISPSRLIYWVIGGALAEKIVANNYNRDVYSRLYNIIVEGLSMQTELKKLGIENTTVIPNFKSISYYPSLNKSHSEDQPYRFVFLSRILPEKGCDLLIEACRVLNSKGLEQRYSLHFYGPIDDVYRQNFMGKIASLSNIDYKGFLDLRQSENYNILAEYEAFVFPTYWSTEGFPGIIIDALISGLPIIASLWNMNAELITDQVTGILIPPKNLEALIESLEEAITNPEKMQRMRSDCQAKAKSYDVQSILTIDSLKEIGVVTSN